MYNPLRDVETGVKLEIDGVLQNLQGEEMVTCTHTGTHTELGDGVNLIFFIAPEDKLNLFRASEAPPQLYVNHLGQK